MARIPLLLLFLVLFISGCATPARHQNMTLTNIDVSSSASSVLKNTVFVKAVTGGKETNPMWLSNVESSQFKLALENSLKSLDYLSTDESSSKYQLFVNLQSIEQPMMGFSLSINSAASYTVQFDKKQKVFAIVGNGSSKVSDAFAFNDRVRITNEKSIKNNIKNFIDKFSEYFQNK